MTTDIPIPTDGGGGGGDAVRPVLLVTSILALTLVLGAGYASIQAASINTAERLEAPAVPVRGAPLMQQPGAEGTADVAAAGAAGGSTTPNGLVTHGRVQEAGTAFGLPELPEGVIGIDYETLALPDYEQKSSQDGSVRPNEEIFPPEILALEGKQVALMGFMVPDVFDDENRKLVSFIVSPFPPGCHFGTLPRADEWIECDATPIGGASFLAYRVVRVVGTLELGEEYDRWGFLMSLYRIKVDHIDVQK
ncbi:hypothetical protein Pla163_31850 [Planctomycetes bacterium Pla163]|jgi:hypothetical protein|uniref:DUF3299 domain-containing protein n=1 Tax=Rohdeia mirabilis TaxID=2528008 RepID=A0A518D3I7_9BACT|nr:hypothetical protein Pla163_31850 [Planctomycetes bacterium Pla163]